MVTVKQVENNGPVVFFDVPKFTIKEVKKHYLSTVDQTDKELVDLFNDCDNWGKEKDEETGEVVIFFWFDEISIDFTVVK